VSELQEGDYCVLIGPHDRADGKIVYAIACPHLTVSTIDVEHRFSPDFGLALLYLLKIRCPWLTPEERSLLGLRMILGFVLAERSGCSCYQRPFGVASSDSDVRVLDLGWTSPTNFFGTGAVSVRHP
jgi:hypothetical protein